MSPEWRELYDWASFAGTGGATQWELYDLDDPWFCVGYVVRESPRRYAATFHISVVQRRADSPRPTKTFRSLKQAKAWVQALAVLNQ